MGVRLVCCNKQFDDNDRDELGKYLNFFSNLKDLRQNKKDQYKINQNEKFSQENRSNTNLIEEVLQKKISQQAGQTNNFSNQRSGKGLELIPSLNQLNVQQRSNSRVGSTQNLSQFHDINQVIINEQKYAENQDQKRSIGVQENQEVQNKTTNSFKQLPLQENIDSKINAEPQLIQKRQSTQQDFFTAPQTFVMMKSGTVYDHYKVGVVLGEGAYGKVYLVTHKLTDDIRAMKSIKKSTVGSLDEEKLFAEVNILKSIDHPNVLKLFEFFADDKNYYLITEYCSGGELFDRIKALKFFSEGLAAYYMRQILSAVVYSHERNIVHRDLKPENLLLDSKKSDALLKVIDFGTSMKFKNDQRMTQKLGTPYYIAPEVLARSYNEKCDVWSCGIIMYILLCGYPPFGGANNDEILRKVKRGKFRFDEEDWDKISVEAKNLITKMLTYDPEKRISAKEALNDIWIQKNAPTKPLSSKVLSNLSTFDSQNKLRQAILTFIALQVTSQEEKEELQQTFQTLDKDGDGLVSKEELIEGYLKVCKHREEAEAQAFKIINEVDVNKSGQIDYTEFIAATINHEKYLSKKKMENAFKMFDQNGDGFITKDEVENVLGGIDINQGAWEDVIKECDSNQDGKISYLEFADLLTQKVSSKAGKGLLGSHK